MLCPACKTVNLVMSERQGVEIDYCPQCRGVWLDRGELDKIIDKSTMVTAPAREAPRAPSYAPEPDRHDHRSHQDGYYKKRRREGFLSDIFDFD